MDLSRDLNEYGFSTEIRVRLSETDAVGIVFFGSFSVYFDVGRMDYLAHLGLDQFSGPVRDLIPGAVVHQEARFHSPARYNETLVMSVRISAIGQTSYTFQFLVHNKRARRLVATGQLTLVWLDDDFKPVRVPDEFRSTVEQFEKRAFS
jgi:acyl-CoA thioester hydrolase